MSDTASLPEPDPTSLGAFYWEGAKRGQLLIQRCENCGTYIHYPRPVCRTCLSRQLVPTEVSGRGTVHSYTEPRQVNLPFFADKLPYVVVSVELEEQEHLRVMSNMVDCAPADVHVGMLVEVVFRPLTPTWTVPYFRPRAV